MLAVAENAEYFGSLLSLYSALSLPGLNFSHDLLGDVGGIIATKSIASVCPENVEHLILEGNRTAD